MITWDDVLELARELPEFEEGTSYGRPTLKVRGKFGSKSSRKASDFCSATW